MFYTIQKRLKEILEAEMRTEGMLPKLKTVLLGDYKLVSSSDYPYVAVDFQEGDVSGFPQKITFSLDYTLTVYCIGVDLEESAQIMEGLLWKDREKMKPEGILPVLIDNSGFTADGVSYRLQTGKVRIIQGKDENSRFTTAAEIPVKITTWKQMM